MNIFDYARKPYPLNQNRWGIIIAISPFVSLFMLVFQPFGLQAFESHYKSILLAGYGLVTFVVLFLNLFILPLTIPGLFKEEKWSVIRQVLFLIWIVVTIAAGNYVYSVLLSIVPWVGMRGFMVFTVFTLLVAIIPIIGVIVISHNRMLRKNLIASREMNELIGSRQTPAEIDEDKITITSGSMNQVIGIPASSLLCIESEGNYVSTWYLEEGKIVRSLVRNTMKNVEFQVKEAQGLFKCHRAFIINLSYVEKVTGNSQGYRVRVQYIQREIPVARNYSKQFREAIRRNA